MSVGSSNNLRNTLKKDTTKIFTEKQGQYLSFIYYYTKINGRPPAEIDMKQYFGVTPPTVHQMVVKLETLGFITRKSGVGRSIELNISADRIPRLN